MTSDPKVHRRLELHSSAHTGRLSRRDILAVLTSEISGGPPRQPPMTPAR